MGCGCKNANSTTKQTWGVKMPGAEGRVKVYSSEQTARAVNLKIPGSTLIPPTSVS